MEVIEKSLQMEKQEKKLSNYIFFFFLILTRLNIKQGEVKLGGVLKGFIN